MGAPNPTKINNMKYTENVNWLFSLQRFGIKPGLVRINRLLKRLGHPERKFPSILVAGTNGKGSTCAIINSILTEAGYKTGLYTSPHILSFRERIRLGRYDYISSDYVNDFINYNKSFIESNGITFFEATTAMAFDYFARSNIDIAVVEVGMGGRWDATNIIRPILSIITSISLDHPEYLGKTLKAITKEKSCISRNNKPLIYSEKIFHKNILLATSATPKISSKTTPLELKKIGVENMQLKWGNELVNSKLVGIHQVDNVGVAITAVNELKNMSWTITKDSVVNGIVRAEWPGRFQVVMKKPLTILDVAHNPDGARRLRETLVHVHETKDSLTIICGIMADKDYKSFLRELDRGQDVLFAVSPKIERSLRHKEIADCARRYNYTGVYEYESVVEAVEAALLDGRPMLIVGSHHTVEEALLALDFLLGIRLPNMIYGEM